MRFVVKVLINYNLFRFSYTASGNYILSSIVVPTGSDDVYWQNTVNLLAESGATVILVICYEEETTMLFNATKNNVRMNSSEVVYVGADWVTMKSDVVPRGTVGLIQISYESALSLKYYKLWESVDPKKYFDSDSNRSTIALWGLMWVDALFSLALAYQKAINDTTGLEGFALQRSYLF